MNPIHQCLQKISPGNRPVRTCIPYVRVRRTYVRTDVRTRVILYAPHYKWRGHKNEINCVRGVELTKHTLVDVLIGRHSDTRAVNSNLMHQSFVCPAPGGPGIPGT